MGDQIVFLVIAAGMIGLGLYFILGKMNTGKTGNLVTVEATVVDLRVETDYNNTDERGAIKTTSSYPVYEYQMNGRTYRAQGQTSISVFSEGKYQIGSKMTIKVDPSNPNRVPIFAVENPTAAIGGVCIAFGAIVFLLTVL